VAGPHRWTYTADPFEIGIIPGAEFVSGWDYVIAPTGHVLSDSGYMPPELAFPRFFPQFPVPGVGLIAHPSAATTTDIPEQVLFLSVPEQFHIGHWFVDFLPRLRALAHAPARTKVALPREAPGKFREALSLFGIGPDRLVQCELGKRYRAQSLVVARPGSYLRPRPSTTRFLRQSLGPAANSNHTLKRRVFLERGVKSRQILNRTEVDAVLEEFGFTVVSLAQLSIAAQRSLLEDTEIAVGVWGSDLFCSFFMPENSAVLELLGDQSEHPAVRPNCQIAGIRHAYLICRDSATTEHRSHQKDRDLVVDCTAFRSALRELLER
jgi:capsular polysaccharide biosynthesis protein